jgi:hypothetical protein
MLDLSTMKDDSEVSRAVCIMIPSLAQLIPRFGDEVLDIIPTHRIRELDSAEPKWNEDGVLVHEGLLDRGTRQEQKASTHALPPSSQDINRSLSRLKLEKFVCWYQRHPSRT